MSPEALLLQLRVPAISCGHRPLFAVPLLLMVFVALVVAVVKLPEKEILAK
jgi:hypothetical protein